MRRWHLLIFGVAFLTTTLGAGPASAAGGTYRIVAGGDQNWAPGTGAIDQTAGDPLVATGTLTGDVQGHSFGNANYEIASGPGIVRAKIQGSFHTLGSSYPFDPSLQAVSTTEITISGPAGEVTTSVNVHVDGFIATPVCGVAGLCGALDVEIHAGPGIGSEFSTLGSVNKNDLGLLFDSVPGGYHVHGDVTTAAMILTANQPVPITIWIALSGRFSGSAESTFDGNFDDPLALSQVSFAPTGPVFNDIPAGYTVSGPAVVNNHWSDPFAAPPPPADTTPPTVTGVPDRPANVFGWYNAPVTIDWQATDASGQAGDPPNTVVTTEGKDITVTSAPSCDGSGNCATGSYTLSIDLTSPTVTCSDPNPTFPVTQHSVAFIWVDVADALSGPNAKRAFGGGADISSPGVKTIAITGSDFAGNEATVTCTYTVVDTTAPVVTGVPDRPANVLGWYNAPVTIDWQTTDDSGHASDPPNTVLATEGKDIVVTSGQSCDASANCATGSYTLSIDLTPPRVTCSDANPTFPVTQHSVAFIWVDIADDLSGAGGTQAVGGGADISSPGEKTIAITGSDFAGNEATVTCTYTVIATDTVPPVVTVPANIVTDATSPAGAPVSFAVSAVDAGDPAAVVTCLPVSGSTFPIGSTTVTCTATDASGNTGTASFTVTVRGADAQIAALSARTGAYLDLPAFGPAFRATLRAATISLAAGRLNLACRALDLYIAEVRLAPLRAFSPTERAALLADAMRIKAVLVCG